MLGWGRGARDLWGLGVGGGGVHGEFHGGGKRAEKWVKSSPVEGTARDRSHPPWEQGEVPGGGVGRWAWAQGLCQELAGPAQGRGSCPV